MRREGGTSMAQQWRAHHYAPPRDVGTTTVGTAPNHKQRHGQCWAQPVLVMAAPTRRCAHTDHTCESCRASQAVPRPHVAAQHARTKRAAMPIRS